jgi:hypothetical protein
MCCSRIESIFCVLQVEGLTFPVDTEYFWCCRRSGRHFLSIEFIFGVLQAEVLTFPVHGEYFLCVSGGGVNSCGNLGGLLHYSCLRGARQAQSVQYTVISYSHVKVRLYFPFQLLHVCSALKRFITRRRLYKNYASLKLPSRRIYHSTMSSFICSLQGLSIRTTTLLCPSFPFFYSALPILSVHLLCPFLLFSSSTLPLHSFQFLYSALSIL